MVSVVIMLALASWGWAELEEGGNVTTWFQNGERLRLAGQLDQALAEYERCVAADPHHYQALMASGSMAYKLGSFDKAAERFGVAAKIRPNDPRALLNLGHTRLKLDDNDGAKTAFLGVLELDSNNVSALIGLGSSRFIAGQWYAALDCFKKALKLQPNNKALSRTVARVEEAARDRAHLAEAERAIAVRSAVSAALAEAAAQPSARQSSSSGPRPPIGPGASDLFAPQGAARPLLPIPRYK